MEILDRIQSFLRFQGDIANKVRFSRLEGRDEFRLTIYEGGPVDEFLPQSVIMAISEVVLKVSEVNFFDLQIYPNSKKFTIEGSTDTFKLIIHSELVSLNSRYFSCNDFKLIGSASLQSLILQANHFPAISNTSLSGVTELIIKFTSDIIDLDLSKLNKLESLHINGNLSDIDQIQLENIQFPQKLRYLTFRFLRLSHLDLSKFSSVLSLQLLKIRSPGDWKELGLEITWSDHHNASLLENLILSDIIFKSEPVIFSGKIFPKLTHLEFESHMNTEIQLLDLPLLQLFRTSLSRYVSGHKVKLYLINCPKLEDIRTSHRITKYIWNCPVNDEFGQNNVILKERPHSFN